MMNDEKKLNTQLKMATALRHDNGILECVL